MQKDEQIVLRAYCLDLNWSLSYSNTLRITIQRLNSAGQVKMDLWKIFTIVAWCREKAIKQEDLFPYLDSIVHILCRFGCTASPP